MWVVQSFIRQEWLNQTKRVVSVHCKDLKGESG